MGRGGASPETWIDPSSVASPFKFEAYYFLVQSWVSECSLSVPLQVATSGLSKICNELEHSRVSDANPSHFAGSISAGQAPNKRRGKPLVPILFQETVDESLVVSDLLSVLEYVKSGQVFPE